jgi:hypothetical protein
MRVTRGGSNFNSRATREGKSVPRCTRFSTPTSVTLKSASIDCENERETPRTNRSIVPTSRSASPLTLGSSTCDFTFMGNYRRDDCITHTERLNPSPLARANQHLPRTAIGMDEAELAGTPTSSAKNRAIILRFEGRGRPQVPPVRNQTQHFGPSILRGSLAEMRHTCCTHRQAHQTT